MLNYWNESDEDRAYDEGWCIADTLGKGGGDITEIQRVDCLNRFKSDSEAVRFVMDNAARGSEFHIRAILHLTKIWHNETNAPEPETSNVVVCGNCGSDNLFRDAHAAYNPSTNNFELVAVYDSWDCQDCGQTDVSVVE